MTACASGRENYQRRTMNGLIRAFSPRVKRGLRKRRQTPTAHMQRSNATCSPQPRYLPLLWVDSHHHPTPTSLWCPNARNKLPRLRCCSRKGIRCHKSGKAGGIVLSRTLCLYHGRRAAVEASVERAGGVIVKFEGDSDDEEPEVEYEVEVDDETTPTKKKVKKMTRLSRNERQRRRAEAQAVQECDILVTRVALWAGICTSGPYSQDDRDPCMALLCSIHRYSCAPSGPAASLSSA